MKPKANENNPLKMENPPPPPIAKADYFMHLDLPVYGKVGMIEGKGVHYFNAMAKVKGDSSKFLKFLVLELLVIDDKFVSEEFLDTMSLKDVSYLVTVVGTMMEDNFKI